MMRLQALRPAHVQSLHSKLLERGLNSKTVRLTPVMFKEALKHAVQWGQLIRNPADAVAPPKVERREITA